MPEPVLMETLGRGGVRADEADLEALARLMLLAIVRPGGRPQVLHCLQLAAGALPAMARPPARLLTLSLPLMPLNLRPRPMAQMALVPEVGRLPGGLDALRAIQRPLFGSAASLDRQLAALHQRCGSGSSGSSLPTGAQLQAAWAELVFQLVVAELAPLASGVRQGLLEAGLCATFEQAARKLLVLQPGSPHSSYEMGNAAYFNKRYGAASRLQDSLPHFQRGAELARAQGSDFWLARWVGVPWGASKLWFTEHGCEGKAPP